MVGLYSISQTGARSSVIRAPVEGNNQQLAVDAQGRIYVMGSRSLTGFSRTSLTKPVVPAGGADLLGIGSDSAGNVYVSASFVPTTTPAAITYVVNDDLTLTPKYPGFGVASIAFDPRGNIWGSGAGVLYTDNPSGTFLGFDIGFCRRWRPSSVRAHERLWIDRVRPGGNLYFIDNGLRIRRLTGAGPAAPPVISTNGIVNAATYTGGTIAPGEIVSIFGTNFGSESLQINAAVNNAVPHAISRTKVQFRASDKITLIGTITAITANQINVFVSLWAHTRNIGERAGAGRRHPLDGNADDSQSNRPGYLALDPQSGWHAEQRVESRPARIDRVILRHRPGCDVATASRRLPRDFDALLNACELPIANDRWPTCANTLRW